MRKLSMRQALRCETACGPRCKCRCGGALHGSARGKDELFFEQLDKDDPHFALSPETQRTQRRIARRRQFDMFDR